MRLSYMSAPQRLSYVATRTRGATKTTLTRESICSRARGAALSNAVVSASVPRTHSQRADAGHEHTALATRSARSSCRSKRRGATTRAPVRAACAVSPLRGNPITCSKPALPGGRCGDAGIRPGVGGRMIWCDLAPCLGVARCAQRRCRSQALAPFHRRCRSAAMLSRPLLSRRRPCPHASRPVERAQAALVVQAGLSPQAALRVVRELRPSSRFAPARRRAG